MFFTLHHNDNYWFTFKTFMLWNGIMTQTCLKNYFHPPLFQRKNSGDINLGLSVRLSVCLFVCHTSFPCNNWNKCKPIFFKHGNKLYALRTRPSSILELGGLHLVKLKPLINQNCRLFLFLCNNCHTCETILFKLGNKVTIIKDSAKLHFEIWRTSFVGVMALK